MNSPWILRIAHADADAVAPLRLWPTVEVAEADPWLWVRGRGHPESAEPILLSLPAVGRYAWLPGDRLLPHGSRIPSERLPPLSWQPLARWLEAELPLAAIPGSEPHPARLHLVLSTDEAAAELLLTPLKSWVGFAAQAAEVRLRPLQFAANAGQALVRGRPLPPLPGRRFVVRGRIGVAAGFHWDPPVGAEVVARRLGVAADGLALWHQDGTITLMHLEQFVAATRSAARATAHACSLPTA